MNKEEILKQVDAYFKMELDNTTRVAAHNELLDCTGLTESCVRDALSRCLGVALFVQQLDIDYEDIKCLYEEYKTKIENFYLTN